MQQPACQPLINARVGDGAGAAASHGTADAVQDLSSADAPRAAAPAAILCAELQ